jgi:ATP-dependent Clp protease ATP-binding subunit ClpA
LTDVGLWSSVWREKAGVGGEIIRRSVQMFKRFTDRARLVLALANEEAQRYNHEYIGTEHILLGLVREGSGTGAKVLKSLGVDIERLRLEVEKLVKGGRPDRRTMGKLPQTPRAKEVIEYAIEETKALGHKELGTGHILLGLLRESDGIGVQVLMNLGLKLAEVRQAVLNAIGSSAKGVGNDMDSAETGQESVKHNLECKSESHGQHLCYIISQGFHLSDEEAYRNLVKAPKFKCQHCGRVANSDKNLCRPVTL